MQWAKRTGLNQRLTKTLKQSVCVRWNSELTMLKSIQDNWTELSSILLAGGNMQHLQNLNKELLDAIVEMLEPFSVATMQLEADNGITIHLALFWIFKLRRHLNTVSQFEPINKVDMFVVSFTTLLLKVKGQFIVLSNLFHKIF